MASYETPKSPVIARFIKPLTDAYSGSQKKYKCKSLGDLDFLESGISRCISAVTSGRDFLQQFADAGRKLIEVTLFFKALESKRRLTNLISVNLNLTRFMKSRLADPFAEIKELAGFDIYAGDGHFHEAACHDPHKRKKPCPAKKKVNGERQKQAKKLQTGHFFILGMRDHHLRHLTLAEVRPGGGNEHDMHVLKRVGAKALRFETKVGRKVMIVWERAGIDFEFWGESKRLGVYFISREKTNMDIQVIGLTPHFDKKDLRNAGVTADEFVSPGGGGLMLRRVIYTDAKGTTYKYLTTEINLPAWVIVLLFKQRWDIEKVFDEVKNKMQERKSWASGKTAKEMHANFICLTHNMMMLLEDEIEKKEKTSNSSERTRKFSREAEAKESGAGYVATLLQRFTVRSVKFVRWIRNFMYQETSWCKAIARLDEIYATR